MVNKSDQQNHTTTPKYINTGIQSTQVKTTVGKLFHIIYSFISELSPSSLLLYPVEYNTSPSASSLLLTPSTTWLNASTISTLSPTEKYFFLHQLLPSLLPHLQQFDYRVALYKVLLVAKQGIDSPTVLAALNSNTTSATGFTDIPASHPHSVNTSTMTTSFRNILHRCLGEIQLMRLSKQLSRADDYFNQKKYQKALKAYNSMNIDGLSSLSAHIHHPSTSNTADPRAMDATALKNVPSSHYAFDKLVANLKYQYYHNRGIVLLKLHQIILAITCFKLAIEQMTLIQVYTGSTDNTETLGTSTGESGNSTPQVGGSAPLNGKQSGTCIFSFSL